MYQSGFYGFPNFANISYAAPYGASAFGSTVGRGSLFSRLFGGISRLNFSNILGTTQRTLGVINQAIPVFYQIKPIWNNAKTMFRVMGALREDDSPTPTETRTNQFQEQAPSTTPITPLQTIDQPQFFL